MPRPGRPQPIALETAEGRTILNDQSGELIHGDLLHAADLRRKYPNARFRTDPSFLFNCHGLTFASRRTCIHSSEHLRMILDDDRYEEIGLEEVAPGDVIVYFDEDGDFWHSGVVASLPEPPFNLFWVVSKWGKAGEVYHRVSDCPYNPSMRRYYRCRL